MQNARGESLSGSSPQQTANHRLVLAFSATEITAGFRPVGSDVPIVSPSGKPARLSSHATFGHRPAPSLAITFAKLGESV